MNNPYSVILLSSLLVSLLGLLVLRLLWLLFKRRQLKYKESAPPRDLLIETLRQQTKERQQAQGAYASLETSLQTIMAHLPSGVLVVDGQGKVRFANPKLWEFLGLSGDVLSIEDLDPSIVETYQLLRQQGGSRALEFSHPDGNHHSLRISLSQLPENTHMLTLVDETRERKLEEQLRYKRDLALMGEMAGGITHEVKNALATIQGHAQLLEYGDVQEHAARIQAEVDHLLRFVQEFMKSSQGHHLELYPIALNDWLLELADYWRDHPKGQLVSFEQSDTTLQIQGDRTLLTTVVNNLILNGIEACEDQAFEGPVVRVAQAQSGDRISIIVEDNGPGFSPDILPKMFVPFVSSKQKGTGLGLFHCRKLMMEHGGELEVVTDLPTRVICHFPSDSIAP